MELAGQAFLSSPTTLQHIVVTWSFSSMRKNQKKKQTNTQTKEQIFKNNNLNYATIPTSPGSFCLRTRSFGFYLINLNKPVDGFSQALGETFSLLFKVTSAFTVSVSSLNERQRWRKREECQNQKEKKSLLKPTLQRLLNTKAI